LCGKRVNKKARGVPDFLVWGMKNYMAFQPWKKEHGYRMTINYHILKFMSIQPDSFIGKSKLYNN